MESRDTGKVIKGEAKGKSNFKHKLTYSKDLSVCSVRSKSPGTKLYEAEIVFLKIWL